MFLSVVAGYFLLADFRGGAASEPSAPWFYTANMEDINRITFATRDGVVGFYQDRSGKAPTWRFDDDFGMPVDISRWGGITLLLSGPQSRRALIRDLKEEDKERYGVNSPILSVDVRLTGERQVNVHLGDKTPDELNYYIRQEGNPGLYLIDGTWGDVLSKITREQPFPPWYFKIDGSKVLYFTVRHGGQELAFLRERFIGEPDRWRFSGPEGDRVDAKRWTSQVIPLLGGPKELRILRKEIPNPAEFGLDAPTTVIHLEYEPPFQPQQDDPDPELRREFDFQVGKALPDGSGYYAQVKGVNFKGDEVRIQEYVFFVERSWLETITGLVTDPPKAQNAATSS